MIKKFDPCIMLMQTDNEEGHHINCVRSTQCTNFCRLCIMTLKNSYDPSKKVKTHIMK
jgi:hypothetical protein